MAGAVLRERIGTDLTHVWVADYDYEWMRRWPGPGDGPIEMPVLDAGPGETFRSGTSQVVPDGDLWWLHVPIVVQGQPLGVLSVRLAGEPSDELAQGLVDAATATGHCLVAGDLFDYVVDGDVLCVTALDAMGHGVQASRLAVLAISAIRNARRAGRTVAEQIEAADEALLLQHGGELFVTALVLALDLTNGELAVVNAGHPGLLLVRDGELLEVPLAPHLPVGMFEHTDYRTQHLQLEPFDRLVVVSDGVLDAGATNGCGAFGDVGLAAGVRTAAGLQAQDAVRHLLHSLTEHQPDQRDDATVVVLDWPGPTGDGTVAPAGSRPPVRHGRG